MKNFKEKKHAMETSNYKKAKLKPITLEKNISHLNETNCMQTIIEVLHIVYAI